MLGDKCFTPLPPPVRLLMPNHFTDTCKLCPRKVSKNIQCELCKRFLHVKCANINTKEFDALKKMLQIGPALTAKLIFSP